MFERVMNSGEATWSSDQSLVLTRKGFTEETYLTWSYSPTLVETGSVGGVFTAVIETTERVLGERRLSTLRALSEQVGEAKDSHVACAAAAATLSQNAADVPFALVYLLEGDSDRAILVGNAGLLPDASGAPAVIAVNDLDATWPLGTALIHEADGVITTEGSRALPITAGPWPECCDRAVILPIARAGQTRPYGMLIAGISPRLEFNHSYRSFLSLVASHIASAVANAHAYGEERRRAEALAEIDRTKTTFFSNVSHEFRTPLTLILGPLSDARRSPETLPPEVRDHLDVAHRNSLRLLKLVNTLLDFTRLEAGRAHARFERVDLCALTTDLASTFRSTMEKAGLAFSVQCEPMSGPTYVDPEMWEKIVLNLISNAFKFTLQGDVTVSVSVEDARAVIAVEDTGTGIPEDQLPHIFERFHRVQGTTGRSHEGSGIGLALVQELVKLHGGELTATSELGRGSRFAVSIPLGSAHLSPAHIVSESSVAVPSGATPYVEEALRWLPAAATTADDAIASLSSGVTAHEPPVGVGRVLLADDNADMRDYARRLMAERWDVQAVTNGREALDAARAQRPDVIVTDVMMPELDGFGLLREIRADPELNSVPVIMLSARAGEEARLEGLAATADDYVVKPFSARDLLARVDAQVVKARLRAVELHHARRVANLFSNAPVAIAVLRGRDTCSSPMRITSL
ncbi:MAG: response regulator [Acidobacteria bacterium]|nr:response regulator [Acidobacteriota bacterium]